MTDLAVAARVYGRSDQNGFDLDLFLTKTLPETGALILVLLLGSIKEAVKQVLYLSYQVNSQQEAMCAS